MILGQAASPDGGSVAEGGWKRRALMDGRLRHLMLAVVILTVGLPLAAR
jgi:hypothetical protein